MPTWNSRGLRGSTLEDLFKPYKRKICTQRSGADPEDPDPDYSINIDKETRHITLAYFEQKSTVDYIELYREFRCFDAKECNTDTFPLANVHPHQVAFMEQFEKQEGIAFLLISFTHWRNFIICVFPIWRSLWNRALDGGRKSWYEELNPAYFLPKVSGVLIPYLQVLQSDLEDRD